MVITNMRYLDGDTYLRYLDGYYQHEIPGWLLPTLDIPISKVNMRYLDGDTYLRYLNGNKKHELP